MCFFRESLLLKVHASDTLPAFDDRAGYEVVPGTRELRTFSCICGRRIRDRCVRSSGASSGRTSSDRSYRTRRTLPRSRLRRYSARAYIDRSLP